MIRSVLLSYNCHFLLLLFSYDSWGLLCQDSDLVDNICRYFPRIFCTVLRQLFHKKSRENNYCCSKQNYELSFSRLITFQNDWDAITLLVMTENLFSCVHENRTLPFKLNFDVHTIVGWLHGVSLENIFQLLIWIVCSFRSPELGSYFLRT